MYEIGTLIKITMVMGIPVAIDIAVANNRYDIIAYCYHT